MSAIVNGDDGIVCIINARRINRGIFFHICSSASFSERSDIFVTVEIKNKL
jgi:hypothetical protein